MSCIHDGLVPDRARSAARAITVDWRWTGCSTVSPGNCRCVCQYKPFQAGRNRGVSRQCRRVRTVRPRIRFSRSSRALQCHPDERRRQLLRASWRLVERLRSGCIGAQHRARGRSLAPGFCTYPAAVRAAADCPRERRRVSLGDPGNTCPFRSREACRVHHRAACGWTRRERREPGSGSLHRQCWIERVRQQALRLVVVC